MLAIARFEHRKVRCGPVECPVLPENPMKSPRLHLLAYVQPGAAFEQVNVLAQSSVRMLIRT